MILRVLRYQYAFNFKLRTLPSESRLTVNLQFLSSHLLCYSIIKSPDDQALKPVSYRKCCLGWSLHLSFRRYPKTWKVGGFTTNSTRRLCTPRSLLVARLGITCGQSSPLAATFFINSFDLPAPFWSQLPRIQRSKQVMSARRAYDKDVQMLFSTMVRNFLFLTRSMKLLTRYSLTSVDEDMAC